jgi:hypothetical protein
MHVRDTVTADGSSELCRTTSGSSDAHFVARSMSEMGVKRIFGRQPNDGYGEDSGPSRGDSRRRTFRPEETFPPTTPTGLQAGCWIWPVSGPGVRGVVGIPAVHLRRHLGPKYEALLRSRAPRSSLLCQRDLSGVGFAMPFAQLRSCGWRFHEVRDPPVSPVRASALGRSPAHDTLPAYARSSAFTASSPPRIACV